AMARAIWTGSINFGLVSIPVGLYSATEDHTVHFHQFQRGTADRVRYQRVNERTGKEVDYADVVKGRDVGDGDYVIVEPAELDDIAPGRSRSIDISSFVDLAEIDPVYFQKTYWLAPDGAQYAHPYALLLEAMARTNRAGIATFVMRGKEYLTAIRAEQGALALQTLFFADEIRNPADELDVVEKHKKAQGKELEMATALIESMCEPWQPQDYHDTYTERVERLIDDKRRGHEVVTEAAPPEPTQMSDLLAALQRSVSSARSGSRQPQPQSGPDLAEASKADLAGMARKLDVEGRSRMTRAELEKAVAEAR
ncbi:MAG: Ku protein, partial [Pseudonocardiaceae bacterium]